MYIRHYLALWSVSDCATWHELLHNPGVVKTWKLTVFSNSRPKSFARFALMGYYTGGWRGIPPKLQKWHPICSQNTTIWKSRDLDTSDDCDITHNLGHIVGVHPHAKSDVIFRYMTSPMNKKSPVLPFGGPQRVWIWGGERGHRFVGFRDFCVDVSPASSSLSRVRTPTTHLTRFLDKRRRQLLSFSQSDGVGGLRGYELGRWWGHRFLESRIRALSQTPCLFTKRYQLRIIWFEHSRARAIIENFDIDKCWVESTFNTFLKVNLKSCCE